MSKYVDISQLEKLAHDVTLANGVAKYRCIDPTEAYMLPGIDIVRCKECRFRMGEKEGFCYGIQMYTNANDFCSRGERREDESADQGGTR